jgi:hypothetical protein
VATVSRNLAKVAVTARAALIVTTQSAVPAQAPPQPVKPEPAAALAVRVTAMPRVTDSEQAPLQLMPAGVLVTVPDPEPLLVTDSVTGTLIVPDPLTPRETASTPAVKFTFPIKVLLVVGRNRTVTVWLAPGASEKEPPDRVL